jgi:hypothetical protein
MSAARTLLLLFIAAAVDSVPASASPASVADKQIWRAQLVDGTMQGSCSQYLRDCQSGTGHFLVPDFTVAATNLALTPRSSFGAKRFWAAPACQLAGKFMDEL